MDDSSASPNFLNRNYINFEILLLLLFDHHTRGLNIPPTNRTLNYSIESHYLSSHVGPAESRRISWNCFQIIIASSSGLQYFDLVGVTGDPWRPTCSHGCVRRSWISCNFNGPPFNRLASFETFTFDRVSPLLIARLTGTGEGPAGGGGVFAVFLFIAPRAARELAAPCSPRRRTIEWGLRLTRERACIKKQILMPHTGRPHWLRLPRTTGSGKRRSS